MHSLFLDVQALNAKERHVILSLVIATFIMQTITFISLSSQVCTMLILFAPVTTYLKDRIKYIGRYSGLSWQETGFKGFLDAQVVPLLSTNFWLAQAPKQTKHVGGSITI